MQLLIAVELSQPDENVDPFPSEASTRNLLRIGTEKKKIRKDIPQVTTVPHKNPKNVMNLVPSNENQV